MTGVVVVGGGIIGCSVAMHLARAGREVTLLERASLTSGTTWHAAGLVAELRASRNLTRLARYTSELYEALDAEGFATGFRRTGAITLACTAARRHELLRNAAMARQLGVECEHLAPDAIRERWPWLATHDVVGALYMPRDGQTSPVDTTRALAAAARAAGALIKERTPVLRILTRTGRATGVETREGVVAADHVVLCAGLWSAQLAASCGANVPLYGAEHFYAVTEPVSGLPEVWPTVRDPDHGLYAKSDAARVLVGCFESVAKPVALEALPTDFEFDQLPFDYPHFEPYLEAALERMPALEAAGIRTWFNGPESFTPDNRYLLGESAEVQGLMIAAGFNSIGIQSAGGVGRVISEAIIAGRPPRDLWDVDVRRTFAFQRAEGYLAERTREVVGRLYAMHWPHRQYERGRGIRRSVLHEPLARAGAQFTELAGWERAGWFAASAAGPGYDWVAPAWMSASREEHLAVRNRVGLFDQSSFGKFMVLGRDATAALGRLCTANVDVPPGRIVYTQWPNEEGGIEADVTVTRIERDVYLVVSGAATQVRDLAWLRRHLRGDVSVLDVTSGYAVLGVMGPLSRTLLAPLASISLDDADFPFATSRELLMASAPVRASRITYVGELGFELYVPVEYAPALYEAIIGRGRAFGLRHAGYFALESLRLEKAYRHFGSDIGDADTVLEAGLGFTIDWDKPGGFIGRDALAAQREAGLKRRLVVFRAEAGAYLFWHDEPIWRDGECVGYLTSGAPAHHLGGLVGLGWVERDAPVTAAWLTAGEYTVQVGETMVPARAGLRAPLDPANERIRC